jgi:hypothetical protein
MLSRTLHKIQKFMNEVILKEENGAEKQIPENCDRRGQKRHK